MTTNLELSATPTSEQISRTKAKIDAYIQSVEANPNFRSGSTPYYGFHEAGKAIHGTVVIFHGFSGKPKQMSKLSDYLFANGFNYYQTNLAGHALQPPSKFWCQVDLKPEIYKPLREKVQKDSVLSNYIANFPTDPNKFQRPSLQLQASLVARLLLIEPRLVDIVPAVERDNDPDFYRYFDSNHMEYLTHAQQRLAELDDMPGPIYTIGLSVGAAIALGLAADKPQRISKVVSYAPLLKLHEPMMERYVNLAGPLDIHEKSWSPGESFPIGALTAAAKYGAFVRESKNVKALQQVPTFMVLTENEDAANIPTNQKFFNDIGGNKKGHRFYMYPASDLVPHPLAEPDVKSQGMTNRFWQSLYQETYRFLTTGEINPGNMSNTEQDPKLPLVPPLK
ncbi:alpha/beta fold hydrolase [Calothrix sp. UHCC 0171]|uniref:alpha/beta fold hydrolase n=1 Tax=Calothrix sp. UHCC 0171 TaxID=3110245 RepID=UPI002B209174|nr:alpha/beta fold hydrolase [Calothrix sp. UHCC 0171]MEA5573802.1 alpha/beta fold hydrolase [Calothrix sp. UHCC 0171]